MFEGRTYWIVGASEGLGRALAHLLDAQGASLVLSARSADRLTSLAAGLRNARVVTMDVTDMASVTRAGQAVGAVDGVVYSVGLYEPLNAANWSDAHSALQVSDANFLGALRVLPQVLPGMVARDHGHVVLIGSLAAHRGLPGTIGYGASKAALKALAESLDADLFRTGVRVRLIHPGFIQSRLSEKNAFDMKQIMTPQNAAARVLKAMAGGRFETSFPAPFAWVFTLGRFLPRWLFLRLF